MDVQTGIAGAKLASGTINEARSAWRWFNQWRYGTVSISSPLNRSIIKPGWFDLEGMHKSAKGIYWIVCPGKNDEYWVKSRIDLHPDGRWKESVHIGDRSGPRESIVSVVWVSEFMHSIFSDIRDRCHNANKWSPIRMKPPSNHYSVVQSIVLQIQ